MVPGAKPWRLVLSRSPDELIQQFSWSMRRRPAGVRSANKRCRLSSKGVATDEKRDEGGSLLVISTAKCNYAVREVCLPEGSQEVVKQWFSGAHNHHLEG